MAKRFSDTEKWKKPWFRRLSPVHKVFWEYLRDNCNHAGIWDIDFELAQFQIGAELKPHEIIEVFKNHILVISQKKWFIIDFIEYQYGCSIDELSTSNRVHQSVLKCLEKYDTSKGLASPMDTRSQGAIDIDKDKDKDKEQVKNKVITNKKYAKQYLKDENYLKIVDFWLDEDFQVSWKEHREIRKKKKGAMTQRADFFILTDLEKLSNNDKKLAIEILDQSARKGWIDVFQLKEKPKKEMKYIGALYECPVCLETYKYKKEGHYTCRDKGGKCDGWADMDGENRRDPVLEFVQSIYKEGK